MMQEYKLFDFPESFNELINAKNVLEGKETVNIQLETEIDSLSERMDSSYKGTVDILTLISIESIEYIWSVWNTDGIIKI